MTHPFEPEIAARRPRRIMPRPDSIPGSLSGGKLLFVRIFLIPFFAVSFYSLWTAAVNTIVQISGTSVPAVITNLVETSDSDGSSYRADFAYSYNDVRHTGSSSVSAGTYQSLHDGQITKALILPNAPDNHPMLVDAQSHEVGSMWLFAGIWNLIMAAFLWFAYIVPIISKRVYTEGVPATATITGKNTSTDENTTSYILEYTFKPVDAYGQERPAVHGKSNVRQADWASAAVGQTYTVLYLPNKPRWHDIYQFGPYQIVA